MSASPVVIGEPVAPALAGYATRGDGDGAPVFDPIVHDAGPHIVWEQQTHGQQSLRPPAPPSPARPPPQPLTFLLEEIAAP